MAILTDDQLEQVKQQLRHMSDGQLRTVVSEALRHLDQSVIVPCEVWQFLDSLDSDLYNRD